MGTKMMVSEMKQFYKGELIFPRRQFEVDDDDIPDMIALGLVSFVPVVGTSQQQMPRRRGRYYSKDR